LAPLVYLDTNVFVYLKEGSGLQADNLISLVGAAQGSVEPPMATSELTLAELLVRPYAEGREDLVAQYEVWMITSNWLQVSAVDREVLRLAARLRADHRTVKLPDAIRLATALLRGCRYVLTADTGLRGRYAAAGAEVIVQRPDPSVVQGLLSEIATP
jgi:predicted nucleic acid-binding protein